MSTKISFQTWSGGDGNGDRAILLGYCSESPKEVLKTILFTHDVYHYKDLYRPIDYNFPCNCKGLIIEEFNRSDLIVIGKLKDIDLCRAVTKSNRNKGTIIESFEKCKKWHTCNNIQMQEKYNELFNEVGSIIDSINE